LFSWLFLASVSGQGPDDNPNEGINPEALPAATLGAAAPAVDPGSPNYKYQNNPCKCQCTDPKDVYGKNGQFGNCQSTYEGKDWCYIPLDATYHCRDWQESRKSGKFWSWEACTTPAKISPECKVLDSLDFISSCTLCDFFGPQYCDSN